MGIHTYAYTNRRRPYVKMKPLMQFDERNGVVLQMSDSARGVREDELFAINEKTRKCAKEPKEHMNCMDFCALRDQSRR